MNATNGETDLAIIEPQPVTMVAPLVTGEEAAENWTKFQAIKAALVTEEDIQGAPGGRQFIKKSGYLKMAAAFGVNVSIVHEAKDDLVLDNGRPYFQWRMTARAIAPNGRYMEAVGACSSRERSFAHPDADVYAQAQTRATSRAISNLIGGGSVSAEEMAHEVHEVRPRLEQTFWGSLGNLGGRPVDPTNTKHLSRIIALVEKGMLAERAGTSAPPIIDADVVANPLMDPDDMPGITVAAP